MIKGTVDLMEQVREDKQDDNEVAEYYMKKPKVYENIETNPSTINKSIQPKIIPATYKKPNKNEITLTKTEKKAIMENINKDKNKENNTKTSKSEKEEKDKKSKVNVKDDNETKEQKALRKKLLKEEKKQKRVQKKQLKEAYTVN
jgi:hypothetical protein